MSVFLTASPLAADGGAAPHYYNAHRQQQHPSSSLAGSSIPSANGNRMTSQQQHQGRAPQQPAAKPLSPVASPPAPASEPLAAKSLPDHKQQQQQEDKPEEWIQLSPEEERHRRRQVDEAEGLSAFCSQHHTSEYNRLKWGDKGSQMYYVPISIQAPHYVAELMEKQARFEAFCAERARAGQSQDCSSLDFGQRTADLPARPVEEEEGLEGQLMSDYGRPGGDREHPTLQGREPIPGLSSPDAYSSLPLSSPSTQAAPAFPLEDQLLQAMSEDLVAHARQQQQPAAASQAAPNINRADVFSSIEAGRQEFQGRYTEAPQNDSNVVVSQPIKTSDTHPINISIIIPPHLTHLLQPLLSLPLPAVSYSSSSPESSFTTFAFSTSKRTFRLPSLIDLHALTHTLPSIDAAPPPPSDSAPLNGRVGNFLLSSCPGKKVRLQGPVKGRGAICRDLGVDLQRIRSLGVGCIICCLDDDELNFLGSPYEEYEANARLVGLDIIRIPMPEGLTPTSLSTFDAHISHIITSYTLRGIDVLAHCRGGVGRAGLVACSWAVKLGLVRPSFTPDGTLSEYAKRRVSFGQWGDFTRGDLEIVEGVVGLVRRRRSVKAIETFEQVRWLVEYVRWLREEAIVLGQEDATEQPSLNVNGRNGFAKSPSP